MVARAPHWFPTFGGNEPDPKVAPTAIYFHAVVASVENQPKETDHSSGDHFRLRSKADAHSDLRLRPVVRLVVRPIRIPTRRG